MCLDGPGLNRGSEAAAVCLILQLNAAAEEAGRGQSREEIHSINEIRILDRKVINRLTHMQAEALKGGRVKGEERQEKGDKSKSAE